MMQEAVSLGSSSPSSSDSCVQCLRRNQQKVFLRQIVGSRSPPIVSFSRGDDSSSPFQSVLLTQVTLTAGRPFCQEQERDTHTHTHWRKEKDAKSLGVDFCSGDRVTTRDCETLCLDQDPCKKGRTTLAKITHTHSLTYTPPNTDYSPLSLSLFTLGQQQSMVNIIQCALLPKREERKKERERERNSLVQSIKELIR